MRSYRVFLYLLLLLSSLPARADLRIDWFDEAVRLDSEGQTHLAFASFLRSAEAGWPEAEFNVAVMLDSGRGVTRDVKLAALWYARAAAHGNRRAAYNMGQLYESGEGVPLNIGLACAWFRASGLAAATKNRNCKRLTTSSDSEGLVAAMPLFPPAGTQLPADMNGVEIVWSSPTQPGPVHYYVEVRTLDNGEPPEVVANSVEISSVFVHLPAAKKDFAWRVLVVAESLGEYLPSEWVPFRVAG